MARGEAATMIKIHKTFESTYACWWGLTEFVWTSTIQWKYITIHGILNFSSIYIKKEKANRETGELIFIIYFYFTQCTQNIIRCKIIICN